uniref:Uncharacterized protein n=1 Tax=Anopheles culicifacies TaxID=139723 RepID=A0A182M6R9_9DIPT
MVANVSSATTSIRLSQRFSSSSWIAQGVPCSRFYLYRLQTIVTKVELLDGAGHGEVCDASSPCKHPQNSCLEQLIIEGVREVTDRAVDEAQLTDSGEYARLYLGIHMHGGIVQLAPGLEVTVAGVLSYNGTSHQERHTHTRTTTIAQEKITKQYNWEVTEAKKVSLTLNTMSRGEMRSSFRLWSVLKHPIFSTLFASCC